jgi:hypothetical protein
MRLNIINPLRKESKMVNILRVVILLVTAVMGRMFWTKTRKDLDLEEKRINSKINPEKLKDESERETVSNLLGRLDILRSLIDKDDRFDPDDFKTDEDGYNSVLTVEDGKVTIEIPTTSDKMQNDKNCIRLYTDMVRSYCDNISFFIKTYVMNSNGQELDLKDYRNFSDLAGSLRKKIVIKVNRGSDEEILELLYHLLYGYEDEGYQGDGLYNLDGRDVRVTLESYSPIIFK